MAMERERETSISSLVGGIVGDVQTLLRNEIALAREEVRQEVNTAKSAGIKLGIAIGVLAVGGLFILHAVAQALADLLNWPTWSGYTILGLVLAIAGGILLSSAQKQLKEVHPVPQQTVETMKENVEWIKDRTTTDRN